MQNRALLDRTNAPDNLWLEGLNYLANVHNHTVKENLRWAIPMTLRHGDTRDISGLLAFKFYEPVYYLEYESFPRSTEKFGYWVGRSLNTGDVLTSRIYDPAKCKVYDSGTVRPANSHYNPNYRAFPSQPQKIHLPVLSETHEKNDTNGILKRNNLEFSRTKFKGSSNQKDSKRGENKRNKKIHLRKVQNDLGSTKIEHEDGWLRRSARNAKKALFATYHTMRTYFMNVDAIPRTEYQIPQFESYEMATSINENNECNVKYTFDDIIFSKKSEVNERVVDLNKLNKRKMQRF